MSRSVAAQVQSASRGTCNISPLYDNMNCGPTAPYDVVSGICLEYSGFKFADSGNPSTTFNVLNYKRFSAFTYFLLCDLSELGKEGFAYAFLPMFRHYEKIFKLA